MGKGSKRRVEDTQKIFTNTIAHIGRLHFGNLKVGDKITIKYDLHNRQKLLDENQKAQMFV